MQLKLTVVILMSVCQSSSSLSCLSFADHDS